MPTGDFALSARLELARRAQRTLDVQYYHIENDATGRYFLRALHDAARRGVRVRLLMDDLYTSGEDELLLGLAATPNFELRLFNPFPAGRGSLARRFAASLFDFDRVQRRMHNKLFIADGAMAVAGGRNIGGRYFTQTAGENFLDLDTFVAGALVAAPGRPVRPVLEQRVRDPDPGDRQDRSCRSAELMRRFERSHRSRAGAAAARRPAPNDLLGYSPIGEDLEAGKLSLIWTTAEAYADSPDRVVGKQSTYRGIPLLDVDSVRYNVVEKVRRARREVVITSPYLIPGPAGLEVMREVRRRGVAISLLTNSLAATDEPLVHTGYRRYRAEMLKLGVELYELSSNRARRSVRLGIFGSSIGRLHAKTAVFDQQEVFVGSMNFDPRSESCNTEIGLFIRSPEMARADHQAGGNAQAAGRLAAAAGGRRPRPGMGKQRSRRPGDGAERARLRVLGPPDAGTAGTADARKRAVGLSSHIGLQRLWDQRIQLSN